MMVGGQSLKGKGLSPIMIKQPMQVKTDQTGVQSVPAKVIRQIKIVSKNPQVNPNTTVPSSSFAAG
jgi:hypothetical protein